jgi:hypothetical protein
MSDGGSDAGAQMMSSDAGPSPDGGMQAMPPGPSGCGCGEAAGGLLWVLAAAACLPRRRQQQWR